MNANSKIFVAGHNGLVGSAIVRHLNASGFKNLVLKTRKELDLESQKEVNDFFEIYKPEYVFFAAAKVGGINANNTFPADFISSNIKIQSNVIESAYKQNVKKMIFLGSSCIYPKNCPQPIKEEYLLTGSLEATNAPYSIAKIAGIETCRSFNRQYGTKFLSLMPSNLYGPGDNYNEQNSHVLPALIGKFHRAKINKFNEVSVWGTGTPKREFLYVDDLADAAINLISIRDEIFDDILYDKTAPGLINVGYGQDLTIANLAEKIAEVVGYKGNIIFNQDMPDGTQQKLLDITRIQSTGWRPKISLQEGLMLTYDSYLKELKH